MNSVANERAILNRALAGDVPSMFVAASNMSSRGNYSAALTLFEAAASRGHATAALCAGTQHLDGIGTPQNPQRALQWYKTAAQKGNFVAQHMMGTIYLEGAFVPGKPDVSVARNLLQAVTWFKAAADQGHFRSREQLGRLGIPGYEVPDAPRSTLKAGRRKPNSDIVSDAVESVLGPRSSAGAGLPAQRP